MHRINKDSLFTTEKKEESLTESEFSFVPFKDKILKKTIQIFSFS